MRSVSRFLVVACLLVVEEAAGFVISAPNVGLRQQQPAAALRNHAGVAPRMQQTVDGVRVGPPPDLPSLLLHNRILYLGMPLVPSVTELVVAQLLYLNYENPSKEVYMYINSVGTASNSPVETEAFAIADTMNYVSPDIDTICLGTAFGTAAMLLASGAKGKRACLPNSTILLSQPRSGTRGQATDIAIKAREVLKSRQTILSILSEKTGQPIEKLQQDSSRTKYLNAEQALAYGIVDKILTSEEDLPQKPTFLSAL